MSPLNGTSNISINFTNSSSTSTTTTKSTISTEPPPSSAMEILLSTLNPLSSSTSSSLSTLSSSDCLDSGNFSSSNVHQMSIGDMAAPSIGSDPTTIASILLSSENSTVSSIVDILNPLDYPLWNGTTSSVNEQHNFSQYCPSAWDGFYCWPSAPSGYRAFRSCADIFTSVIDVPEHIAESMRHNNAYAYRICDQSGTWYNNWTNYSECLQILVNNESDYSWDSSATQQHQLIRRIVVFIMFFCSIVSLALLLITLFIFFYFKSLASCRIRVHRNLVLALIIHSALLIVLAWPHLSTIYTSTASSTGSHVTTSSTSSSSTTTSTANNNNHNSSSKWLSSDWIVIDWLCKLILTMKLYSTLASINWMFIEGLLLHSRITVSVFRKDAPFKLYYFIGWGLPLIVVLIWATQMTITLPSHCWSGYGDSIYIWIIVGPMIIALLINCIFLVNIIRILLTKLRLTVTIEMNQIKKAIKATALLFPLLGISHLLFCINPDDNGKLEGAYMIANAFLQSSQGIFVAILYCFMDSEVKQVLRNSYHRNTRLGNGFSFSRWSRNTSAFRNRSYITSQTSISCFPTAAAAVMTSNTNTLEMQSTPGSNGHLLKVPPMSNGSLHNHHQHHYLPVLSKPDPNHLCPPTPPLGYNRANNGSKDKRGSFKFRRPPSGLATNGPPRLNAHQVNSGLAPSTKPRMCIVYNSTSGQMVRFNHHSPNGTTQIR